MKKYLSILFILPLLFISLAPISTPTYLIETCHAQGLEDLKKQGDDVATSNPQAVEARAPFFPGQDSYENIGDYISGFYTFSIWVVTIISVIMIIWGAYMIITSSGNPEAIKKGREIIFSALVSLGLLVMATVILGIINPQLVKNPWVDLGLPNYGQSGDSIPANNGDSTNDGTDSINKEDNIGTNDNFFPAPTPSTPIKAPEGPIAS